MIFRDISANWQCTIATSVLPADTWLFIATVFDGSVPEARLYAKTADLTTVDQFVTAASSTSSLADMTANGGFVLGAAYAAATANTSDAYFDAVAVFNRAFSESELDGVVQNGWDGGGWDN